MRKLRIILHYIIPYSYSFQKDVFQLKDIEKIAPKTKGISECISQCGKCDR